MRNIGEQTQERTKLYLLLGCNFLIFGISAFFGFLTIEAIKQKDYIPAAIAGFASLFCMGVGGGLPRHIANRYSFFKDYNNMQNGYFTQRYASPLLNEGDRNPSITVEINKGESRPLLP